MPDETQYSVIWVADFLHSFPHINFSFQFTNSTFDPVNTSYQEALGFWVVLPVLWATIWLLIYTCCACFRCCKKSELPKKGKATCLRVTIGLFLFFTIVCQCREELLQSFITWITGFNPMVHVMKVCRSFINFWLPRGKATIWLLIDTCCACFRCCKKSELPKKGKAATLHVRIGLFLFFTIAALGVGFYWNEEVNKGANTLITSSKDTHDTVNDAVKTLRTLDDLAENVTVLGVATMESIFNSSVLNKTAKAQLIGLMEKIRSDSSGIRTDIDKIQHNAYQVDFSDLADGATFVEFYRWFGTIILFCWHIFLCLLFLLGIIKRSTCLVTTCAVIGLISELIIFAATGIYLGASVGAGDFCVDPNRYIEHVASGLPKDVLDAYIECKDTSKPFSTEVHEAINAVTEANNTLSKVVNMSLPAHISQKIEPSVKLIRRDLKYAFSNLTTSSSLPQIVTCEHIHESYVKSLNGLCHRSLIGICFVLMMCAFVGLCLTILVFLAFRTWPYFGKRRGYYPVDDTDPFLPRPPPYNDYGTITPDQHPPPPSDLPSSYQVTSQPGMMESVPLQGPLSDSPPPAYYAGNFVEQYNDLHGRTGPSRRGHYNDDVS